MSRTTKLTTEVVEKDQPYIVCDSCGKSQLAPEQDKTSGWYTLILADNTGFVYENSWDFDSLQCVSDFAKVKLIV